MINVKEEALKVHCISQEYWYIRRCRCDCGGAWKVVLQKLGSSATNPDVPLDTICCCCSECNRQRNFAFDISSFFPPTPRFMKLVGLAGETADESLRQALLQAAWHNRMDLVIDAIEKFIQSSDTLAIDYIEDAIRWFQQSTSQNSG